MTNVRDWQVIVTDDEGAETWFSVPLTEDSSVSWAAEAAAAIEEARNKATEQCMRVADVRVDWQQMFESTAEDLRDANNCIEAVSQDCWREDREGFEYIDGPEFKAILSMYGRL